MEQINEIRKFRGIVQRRLGWLLLPFIGVTLAATALALVLPNRYLSTATILIKDQQIPNDLVPSTVASFADQRVQAITQEVMSRSRILQLVEKYDLLKSKRDRLTTDDVVEMVRKRIFIEPVRAEVKTNKSSRQETLLIAFRLSFEDESPRTAQAVTNEISSYYLEKNLESRERVARGATAFLQDQIEQVKTRIGELENQLAEFRKAHLDELPEFTQLHMQKLEKLSTDITNINLQLRTLEEQRSKIRSQMASVPPHTGAPGSAAVSPEQRLHQARMERAQLIGRYSDTHPMVQAKNREIALLEKTVQGPAAVKTTHAQIQTVEAQLAALLSRYGEDHPQVQKTRQELEGLRQELAALQSDLPQGSTSSPPGPTNPAYIALQSDLAKTDVTLASLKEERARLEEQSRKLFEKLRAMPEVAKVYNALEADLHMAKNHYQELQQKFLAAKVSQNMEEDRLAENFEIIEPAFLPEEPSKPNRLAILIVGMVLGMGLSVGLAALREFTDDRLYDREDLERLAGLPVLGVIPKLVTDDDKKRIRRKRAAWSAAAAACVVFGILAFHLWVMDLYVFYAKVARFLGRKVVM